MKESTAAAEKQRSGTTWLIYGPAGVGKTPFASCFPNPWWWDCEGGTQSILFGDIPVGRIEGYGDVLEGLSLLQQAKDRLVRFKSGPKRVDTVVVDTLGELCRIILGTVKGSRETAQLQDWGLMIERIRNRTRDLRDLRDRGFNIVFLTHEQYLKADETQLVMGLPDLPGKELPNDLPKLCDIVGHMIVRRNQKNEIERVLITEPDGVFIGRDRLYRFKPARTVIPSFDNPKDIQHMLEKAGVVYAN